MNKLGNKEVILILVVINFMLYYLMFFIGVSPLKKSIAANRTDIAALQDEYDEKQAIVDSEDMYIADIERLKAEKVELFATGFPNTNAENLHAFMTKEATNNKITISSININQAPRLAEGGGENARPTGIMDNDINITATGSYNDITKLLESIEQVQKTSILTSFSLTGDKASDMLVNMTYSFLSADKSEAPDPIFDHDFGQAAGNPALFK